MLKCGYLLRMVMASKGSIYALLTSCFRRRINYVVRMTNTKDNSLLGRAKCNMLIMLRMNQKFLKGLIIERN